MKLDAQLKEIIEQYEKLLVCYEKIYEMFTSADCKNADEYMDTIIAAGDCVTSISAAQLKIEEVRKKLKADIHNDILVDNVIDSYSNGRFSNIVGRIADIMQYIQEFENKAKSTLGAEMNKIKDGLNELGIDEEDVKLLRKISENPEDYDKK